MLYCAAVHVKEENCTLNEILTILLISADKPGPVKKAVTPQHRKALNRPRRRLVQVNEVQTQELNS